MSKKLPLLIPLLLGLVLLTGVFLPVYSDEVMTKFNMARFFLENGQMVSFYPQCATTIGHAVAWVFYPAAILISAVYAHLDPLGIRISGIVLAFTWFALLAWWCMRQDAQHWARRFSLFAAFAALGVLPYLWVMSRPEQFMLIPMLFFCICALHAPALRSRVQQTAMAVLMAVLLSVFFYVHPKSLFFAPFFLVATWQATRHFGWLIRSAFALFVLALSVQVLRDANTLGSCEDAPFVQTMLAFNIVRPGMLFSEPLTFLMMVAKNLLLFLPRTLEHLTFSPIFQSGWLPPLTQNPGYLPGLNLLVYCALAALIALSHLLALGMAALAVVRRRLSLPVLLAALLAAADVLNAALYNIQNFYAGIQYIPISIMILALLLERVRGGAGGVLRVKGERLLMVGAGLLALVSLASALYLLTPNLKRNADFPTASLPGQPLSIPLLNTQAHLDAIRELGKQCHIPTQSAQFLVVDHMTYFAYRENRTPAHVHYVSELAYGGDLQGDKLLPFLKGHHSPGVITRCEWIPPQLRSRQQQNPQGYCCVDLSGE